MKNVKKFPGNSSRSQSPTRPQVLVPVLAKEHHMQLQQNMFICSKNNVYIDMENRWYKQACTEMMPEQRIKGMAGM